MENRVNENLQIFLVHWFMASLILQKTFNLNSNFEYLSSDRRVHESVDDGCLCKVIIF